MSYDAATPVQDIEDDLRITKRKYQMLKEQYDSERQASEECLRDIALQAADLTLENNRLRAQLREVISMLAEIIKAIEETAVAAHQGR